jgi:hypothetical protein
MLDQQSAQRLLQTLAATAELLGHELSPTAAALMVRDLSVYPMDVLERALARVRTEHTGKLTPKAIIDRIDEVAGRPTANEAWAMAMSAQDERNTVVWTQEASDAWAIAKPIADSGDMVGARMAFIAAYDRLVRTAREERRMPVVTVSLGWDEQLRAVALEKAVKAGYLSDEAALEYAPQQSALTWVDSVKLLTGDVQPGHLATPEQREKLRQLRDELAAKSARRAEESAARAKAENDALTERKREVQKLVDEQLKKGGDDVR